MAIQYWSEKEKKTITEDFFKSFFLYVRATVAELDRFWSALTSVPTLYNVHMLHKWRLVKFALKQSLVTAKTCQIVLWKRKKVCLNVFVEIANSSVKFVYLEF